MAEDLELRIGRLELEPGDILVIQTDGEPSQDLLRFAHERLPRLVNGIKILVIPGDVHLSVLSRAEIESRAS